MDEHASERPAQRPAADKPAPIAEGFTVTPAPGREPADATQPTNSPAQPAPGITQDAAAPAANAPVDASPSTQSQAASAANPPEAATPREATPLPERDDALRDAAGLAPQGQVGIRAGDMDRRRVASVLHDALGKGQLTITEFDERTATAWAAKYIHELDALTVDLIAPRPGLDAAHQAPRQDLQPPASARVTGDGGPTASVAIFSGFERKGVWTVPERFTAVAVMGGGLLDLRQANFGAQQVTITATAIMGGIEIIVPDDVNVHVSGFGFMGAFDDARKWNRGEPEPDPNAPTVTINGFAMMGGVEVTRKASGPVNRR